MSNEVVRQKAVDKTVEDMNEWVDELHTEINDAKMAVKLSGREAKSANDKLDKVTSIACTRILLLKDLKLRLAETTDMLLYECHQQETLEHMRTIHMEINRERQVGRRGGSGKWTLHIFLLICETLVNGKPLSAVPTNIQTVSAALTGTAACELPYVEFVRKC